MTPVSPKKSSMGALAAPSEAEKSELQSRFLLVIAVTQTPRMAIAAPDDINETSNTVVHVITAITHVISLFSWEECARSGHAQRRNAV
jgi:hypothetical protein